MSNRKTRPKIIIPMIYLLVILMASPSNLITNSNASTVGFVSGPLSDANPAPLIIARSDITPVCSQSGLCPAMLVTAYRFDKLHSDGINGTGQAVVIVDACGDPELNSDLHTFDSQFGLADPALNIIFPQGTSVCSRPGWALETALDVEWSHVVALGATIDVLVAAKPSFADLFAAWNYSISNSLGNQISNSWGGSSPCRSSTESILDQAKAQNVTVLASSGDKGAWGVGQTLSAQSPADCKEVLTVGGTTLSVSQSGKYVSESAWSATGGGYVPNVVEPKYQSSVNIIDPTRNLGKPDVAAVADPSTGVWVFDSGWVVVGGTSVSSPLWAGFIADVNQIRSSNGFGAAGFVTPFLYTKIYGVSGSSSLYGVDFHDVITGSNGFPAGVGWDADTGLGSFVGSSLANTLGTSKSA